MNELISNPHKLVEGSSGVYSKWNAAWHPVIFKFQRKDWTVLSIFENTWTGSESGIAVSFGSTDLTELSVGDVCYLNAGPYVGLFTVSDTFVDNPGGGPSLRIVLFEDVEYTGDYSDGGFMNVDRLRPDYFLEISLMEYSSGSAEEYSTDYARFRSDKYGLIKADIQSWIRSLISADNDFSYDVINERMINLGQPFNIRWREFYNGLYRDDAGTDSLGAWSTVLSSTKTYLVNAVKRVGDKYGQNMAEYAPFILSTTLGSELITNGNFNSDLSSWMVSPPWIWSGGKAKLNNGYDDGSDIFQSIYPVSNVGDVYKFSFVASGMIGFTAGNYFICQIIGLSDGGGSASDVSISGPSSAEIEVAYGTIYIKISENGTYEVTVRVSGYSEQIDLYYKVSGPDGPFVVYLDDVSVKKVTIEYKAGKFLTKFVKPKYFEGYPFALFFLNEESLQPTVSLSRRETIDSAETDTPLLVGDESSPEALNYGYVNAMSLDGGYTGSGSVGVSIIDDSTEDELIQEITVEIDEACYDSPVYLCWLNPLGGFDYWLFHTNQDSHDITESRGSFESYIEDLADVNGRAEELGKRVQEEMDLGANQITIQQADGLRHLLRSPKVYRYMGTVDSVPQWQVVRVKTGSFLIRQSFENKADLSLTIILPEPFVQQQ